LKFPLEHYPGMNRFVLDWMAGDERFLPRNDVGRASARPGGLKPALHEALADSNRRWGLMSGDEVRRWAAGGTFTVVAGQQVGFAGGPLYTLVKIASLLKIKQENEKRGIPTTAFFWLATEDHDYNEAAAISIPRKEAKGQLDLITLRATHAVESRQVVGEQVVPESLIVELCALLEMERPAWLREGITFRDSFAELLGTIVGRGIVLVDALLPELRRAGAPLFAAITAKWNDVQRALEQRAAALKSAGYAPQILPREDGSYTLLYELDARGNRELVDAPRALPNPERVSTSALTRPLLQDFVLRPDLFLGGPAEVAYYAQIAPLHEMLGVPMPRVGLRAHALVAPRRAMRAFDRFAIEAPEIFTGADALLAAREPAGVAEIKRLAESARVDLAEKLTRIGEIALPADHALARAVSRSIGHIEYHFDKLTERAIRGLARKDRERWTAVRELVSILHPDGHLQDRVAGWIAYWCEFREDLVARLIEEVEPDAPVVKIIGM
jgi:bacillithiol synthase